MKKVVLAIVILLVIVTAGALETVYIDNIFGKLDGKLDESITLIEAQDSEAYTRMQELTEWWEKRRGYLELFVFSPDIRAFSVALGEAVGSLKCEDYDNALSKVQSLLVMSKNIHNILDFNITDII